MKEVKKEGNGAGRKNDWSNLFNTESSSSSSPSSIIKNNSLEDLKEENLNLNVVIVFFFLSFFFKLSYSLLLFVKVYCIHIMINTNERNAIVINLTKLSQKEEEMKCC